MKIKLEEAIELLKQVYAVKINHVVSIPSVWNYTENDDNQFMQAECINEEGESACMTFEAGPNREVEINGSNMFLTENCGDKVEILLLQPWNVEALIVGHARHSALKHLLKEKQGEDNKANKKLQAIEALIQGRFDDPALLELGELHYFLKENIFRILEK